MDNKFYFETNKLYLFFLAVLITILFILSHYVIGVVSVLFFIVLIVYNFYKFKNRERAFLKFITDFSSKMDIATKNTLINMPFPLIICNNEGGILWYNGKFNNKIESEELLGNNIKKYIKDFSTKEILHTKEKVYRYVSIDNEFYEVTVKLLENEVKGNKEDLFLLYLNNKTEEINLYRQKEDSKSIVLLIEVDNLEDVLKVTDEDNIPLLTAEIERTIKNYASKINAVNLKYSPRKYLLISEEKYIKKEMDSKFEILEEIKGLQYGNTINATLSIGVGRGGEHPEENFQFANSAMELALSRGGDQVVVKTNDHLEFFGGKSKEVEKRSRVKVRVMSNALKSIINESSNVYIMGHTNPDLDFLGSALGLSRAVKILGKKCYIIIDEINNSLKSAADLLRLEEEYNNLIVTTEKCYRSKDKDSLLLILDVNNKNHVGNLELASSFERKVIIDHHRKAPNYIEDSILFYIEPYASSTCELITEMLQYIVDDIKDYIRHEEVNLLLAGINVDTKNFYFKTGIRTFQAAAYLKGLGANSSEVKKILSRNLESYKSKAKIISTAEIENNIAFSKCSDEISDNTIAAQAADDLLSITDIKASFVLIKIEDDILISARSYGDINVQIILESLGGGGHLTIAGAKLSNISLEKAEEILKNAIENYLKEGGD
ncbi:DHH family phosphoesterase [Clostridium sediminicola]|uniref:DHH family phosphoesterase n=1 Tax=Clostridium sediminicola TaxID=3114879 RepID=UPI0031F244D8